MSLRRTPHLALLLVALSAPVLPAQTLTVADRIEIRDGASWRRGVVSDDGGGGTLKVRVDGQGAVSIVARASVRPAPRPASINVGDRLEWNGASVSNFEYVPATVKTVGTGSMQGYYLMAWDKYPNSPTYTKRENLWMLPTAAQSGGASTSGMTPLPGAYRCFAYGAAGAPPIFLAELTLANGGTYTALGKRGRYTFDAATNTIAWADGWAKENGFGGAVESNATFRLRSNALCSHE